MIRNHRLLRIRVLTQTSSDRGNGHAAVRRAAREQRLVSVLRDSVLHDAATHDDRLFLHNISTRHLFSFGSAFSLCVLCLMASSSQELAGGAADAGDAEDERVSAVAAKRLARGTAGTPRSGAE